MAQPQVLSCKAPPVGFGANVVVLVTFAFELTKFDSPINITRGVKRDNGEWRHYPVMDVLVPATVKLYDVPVCKNDRGNFYLQLPNIAIPREVAASVVDQAMKLNTPDTDVATDAAPPAAA